MAIDILIFAAIAAFLIFRLNSVLGTRHGGERQRPNPFAKADDAPSPAGPAGGPVIDGTAREMQAAPLVLGAHVENDADGKIRAGLEEIKSADAFFDLDAFMKGAGAAFNLIVTAYAKGDISLLKTLLSDKLLRDFERGVKSREAAGQTTEITVHRITRARVIEAHLRGVMAYVTVDFDVEQTTVTRDADGRVVDGDPDRIFSVEDIWTFARDTRDGDPNWQLVETRAGGNAS